MSRFLQPPRAGQPIRASFFSELLREIRANRLLNGSGYRAKRTPNGTSLVIKPGKDASAAAKIKGCFEMRYEKGEKGSAGYDPGGFDNPYVTAAGKTYYCEDLVNVGLTKSGPGFIALGLNLESTDPSPQILSFDNMGKLKDAQNNMRMLVLPLYELDEHGEVKCDFRIGATGVTGEF